MIQPQRQLHRRVFLVLGILLPLFYLAAIHARHRAPGGGSHAGAKDRTEPACSASARALP
jgi:hypothetical protein